MVSFDGKRESYLMWSDKFLAKASILGYSEILLGDTEIPMDSEMIDVSTAEGRLKDKA